MPLDDGAPEGLIYYQVLPDGRAVGVTPQLFGAGIITIGPHAIKSRYDHQWMYSAEVGGVWRALQAADAWDPMTQDEPEGWDRTDFGTTTHRWRRRSGGDPNQEYEGE